jgi:exodeoxyribonuclease-3
MGNLSTVTGEMENAGYKDILLKFHKDFQHTIPTTRYKSRYSKRIDFVYVNPKLEKAARSAEIIRDNVTDNISDHYPVFVTFNLK